MEITRNGFVRFLSALMSAIFVFTFLPFNAVGVYAEGDDDDNPHLGYDGDGCFTVVVSLPSEGEEPKTVDYSFKGKGDDGQPVDVKNEIKVYNKKVEKAQVTIKSLSNIYGDVVPGFDETVETDSDGKAKFSLWKYFSKNNWRQDLFFSLEVVDPNSGYYYYTNALQPNWGWDHAYDYYSARLESKTSLKDKLDDIAGIAPNGYYEFDYVPGVIHKASDFFTLTRGLNVEYADDNEPDFSDAGTYKYSVWFYGEGYTDDDSDVDEKFERKFTVEIHKIDRTIFSFPEPKEVELDYVEGKTTYQLPKLQFDETAEPGDITYTISSGSSNVATVSDTGLVTFNKPGTVTVKATMSGGTNYNNIDDSYKITALKRMTLSFEKDAIAEAYSYGKECGQEVIVEPEGIKPTIKYAVLAEGTTAPKYSINEGTGKVTIKSAGAVVVQATVTASGYYTATKSYKINIGQAVHELAIKSDDEFISNSSHQVFTDGYSGFEYNIVKGTDGIEVDGGNIIIKKGDVDFEITIWADSDPNYIDFPETTITGKTKKAQQTIELKKYDANNASGLYTGTSYCKIWDYSGSAVGSCSVNPDPDKTDSRIESAYFDTDNKTIIVVFNNYISAPCVLDITLVFSGNEYFEDKEIPTTLTIGYISLNTEVDYDGTPGGDGYFTTQVTVKPKDGNVRLQDPNGSIVPDYTLKEDGIHSARENVRFYSRDNDQYFNIGDIEEIKIDKTNPSFSINITDPTKPVDATISQEKDPVFKVLLESGVYGVYAKNTLTVTVTATDATSGVDTIKYALGDSWTFSAASEVDYDTDAVITPNGRIGTFMIPANSSEIIRVWVTDKAGNQVYTYDMIGNYHNSDNILLNGRPISTINEDDNEEPHVIPSDQAVKIVTDDIVPEVTVDFEGDIHTDKFAPYFSSARRAKITIKEENYFADDVKLSVIRDGKKLDKSKIHYHFDPDNDKIIYVEFTESGSYQFAVEYSDPSRNKANIIYNGESPNSFVIDTTKPLASVSYNDDSDTVKHKGEYFSTGRTATITIDELNYSPEGLTVSVKIRRNLNDKFAAAELSKDYVIHPDTTDSGITTVDFISDGDYEVEVFYQDLAGNEAETAYYNEFARHFTIDTKEPIVTVTYADRGVHNKIYFNYDRTATITIKERNFDIDNAKYSVNGDYFIPNWTTNPDTPDVHTFDVPFTEESEYKFAVYCTDKADNPCSSVDYGEIAPQEFVIDKSEPKNLTIMINGESVVGENLIASDEKSVVSHSISFDKFYNDSVTIFVSADCSISGLFALQYQLAEKSANYNISDEWLDYDDSKGITVAPGTQFVLYFRAIDKASNIAAINSTGIIIDNKEPEGEKNAPEVDIIPSAPNSNGFYNGDVSVRLTAKDPAYIGDTRDADGSYSGLKRITYRIYTTDTYEEEKGTLLNLAIDKDNPRIVGKEDASVIRDNLAYSWTKVINIDSGKYNSNNVIVEVIAEDNAGNTNITRTTPGAIKIDVTAPTIDISYNNNNADVDNCFKEDRVATITITERNFDPKDVKVSLTSSTGTMPEVNGWTKQEGSGNGDNTKWITTIPYTKDADYTFDIAYTDLAYNVATAISFGNSVAPKAFTIDKTVPTVNVSYDNNAVANDMYYNKVRTATVTIVERNFDAGRVNITLRATDDGATINVPAVSNWSNNGETHTATIVYDKDGRYVFDISVKDKAGNDAADFAEQTFFVDTKVPELKITGVKDKSANNGDLEPVITYSDTNYSEKFVTVNFSGASRGKLDLDGEYTDIKNGRTFKFNNFAKQKEIDDIYTLEVTVIDLAGNKSTQLLTFSINRFGSTYELDEAAKTINGTYVQKPVDIVISEINPNQLVENTVTIFKNNESIKLVEGVDYDVQMTGGNGEWCGYKYTIHSDVFADDGVYKVSVYSRDEAGNISENTLDTKNTSLQFGIDATSPNIVAANLSGNTTYAEESHKVSLIVTDNLLLSGVDVYLDDYNTPYVSWTAEQVAEILTGNGSFTFDITDYSNSAHKVKIVGTDAAGNVSELEITNFYVTTNLFVRYYTNTPLVIGSIVGLFLIVALAVVIVVVKRKKISRR